MHAGRSPARQRRAFEGRIDTLLVEGVTSLVQRREQGVADVVLAHPRGDPHVAGRKSRAERMVSLVEPAAIEVVAKAPRHSESEIKLRRFGKGSVQAASG